MLDTSESSTRNGSSSIHKRALPSNAKNGNSPSPSARTSGTRVPAFPNPWQPRNNKRVAKTSTISSLSSYKFTFLLTVLVGSLLWMVGESQWNDTIQMPLIPSSLSTSLTSIHEKDTEPADSPEQTAQRPVLEAPESSFRMVHKDTNQTRSSRDARRPHFIFHIGPPKTATTTFQYSLTYYTEVLPRDGYRYLGQIMKNPDNMWRHDHGPILTILKDRNCMLQVYRWRTHRHTRESRDFEEPNCWRRVREWLKEHRQRNESIILSEENFSIKYVTLGGRRDSVDWIALAELLAEVDFQPLVLIGYRRLYDILPSAKQQWDRWTSTQLSLNAWPGQRHPARPNMPTAVGRTLQPLFPQILEDTRLYDNYVPRRIPGTIQWSYTDYLVKIIRPHLPVRLLNMHMVTPEMSLRTYFLCHVLPYAPASCAQSMADDTTDPETRYNKEESLFYDAIACGAAERKWFNTTAYQRHNVVLALQQYYKEEHGGNIQADVPISCPPRDQLDVLLERSLAKEEQLWPPHLVEAWREDHVAGFEAAVAKNKFCWIDVNATLNTQDHWKQWFTLSLPRQVIVEPLPTEITREQRMVGAPLNNRQPRPPPVQTTTTNLAASIDSDEDDGGDDGSDGSDSEEDDDGSGSGEDDDD